MGEGEHHCSPPAPLTLNPAAGRVINEESIFRCSVWRNVTVLPAGFTIQQRQVSLLLQLDATFVEKLVKDIQHQLEKHPKQKN